MIAALIGAMPGLVGAAGAIIAVTILFRVWILAMSRLIELLQVQISQQQDQLANLGAQHRECERGQQQLRSELEGMRRQWIELSMRQGVPIGPLSPNAEAAAARVRDVLERSRKGSGNG